MTLAHQLRDLPGFAWGPGMRVRVGNHAFRLYMGAHGVLCGQGEGDGGGFASGWTDGTTIEGVAPDLTDSATAGILLRMVGPDVSVWIFPDDRVHVVTDGADGSGPTLGDACAALMVARGRCG